MGRSEFLDHHTRMAVMAEKGTSAQAWPDSRDRRHTVLRGDARI
jgi:hypothetical protein